MKNQIISLILIISSLFTHICGSTLRPVGLTVEYLSKPPAVDRPNPRLAWILEPIKNLDEKVPRNLYQTAYQVLVASSSQLVSLKQPDLWDSSKVQSDATFNVKYRGKVLQPGQQVYWTVRIWDQDDRVSNYSMPSSWGNAFNETHWTAKWIGAPRDLQKQALVHLRPEDEEVLKTHDGLKPVIYVRKCTAIDPGNIKQARLYVTSRGLYRVFFNSPVTTFSNQGQPLLSPGWTDYNKTIQYQVYDVTRFITNANITIGAMLGTGWYSGYVGPRRKHSYYGNMEFLLLEAHIEYQNGTRSVIASDETWKATTGPIIYSDILQGELFYENRQLGDWMQPNYNDSLWVAVTTEGVSRSIKLVAEVAPQVTDIDLHSVKQSWNVGEGVWVYDFGANFAGYAQLSLLEFPYNVTIEVKYGEMLNPNGTVYRENLGHARAIDTYVCNDALNRGVQLLLLPKFTYHGFRYVEVSGIMVDAIDDIKGIVIGMNDMIKSTFESGNALVHKLHKNIVRGQISNMISVPTDCPQRDERLGWMADAQIFAPTAIYNGDVAGFYTKWMRDVREAQSSEGAFSDVSPRLVDKSDGAPAWGDAGVILTWHMYQMYGDVQMVNDNYEAMEKWLNYILSSNPTFIWRNKLNHNYGDWLNVNVTTPKEVVSTAYFANNARLMSQMAKAIGKTEDGEKYTQLFANITGAFNKEFVNRSTGRIEGNTQTVYVLALAFELLPEDLVTLAIRHLVDDIEAHDMHLTTGFIGTAYLLPVLSKYGRSDIAYKLLLQETYPSWGHTIKNNATTIWERWDGWSKENGFQNPKMNSFNHYAFGSVGSWLFQYMAGIQMDATAVGFKKIVIKPYMDLEVKRVSAKYSSIRGDISSSWSVHKNIFTIKVIIPPNTQAHIILPFMKEKWERNVTSGEYEYNVKLL